MRRVSHRISSAIGCGLPAAQQYRKCHHQTPSTPVSTGDGSSPSVNINSSRSGRTGPLSPAEEITTELAKFKRQHKLYRRREMKFDALRFIRKLSSSDAASTWLEERSASSLVSFCAYFKVDPNENMQTKLALEFLLQRCVSKEIAPECAATLIPSLIHLQQGVFTTKTHTADCVDTDQAGGRRLLPEGMELSDVCLSMFTRSIEPHLKQVNFKAFSVSLTSLGVLTNYMRKANIAGSNSGNLDEEKVNQEQAELQKLWQKVDEALGHQLATIDDSVKNNPGLSADPLTSITKALCVHYPQSEHLTAVFECLRGLAPVLWGYQMGSILTSLSKLIANHVSKIDTVIVSLIIDRLQHQLSMCSSSDHAACLWGLSRLAPVAVQQSMSFGVTDDDEAHSVATSNDWEGIETEILLLFEAAESHVLKVMKRMSAQERIMAFQAFLDTTGSLSQELVDRMRILVARLSDTLSHAEVAQVLGILSRSGNMNNEVLAGVAPKLLELIPKMSPKQIANTLLAFSVVPRRWQSGAFRNIFTLAAERLRERELKTDQETVMLLLLAFSHFCGNATAAEMESVGVGSLVQSLSTMSLENDAFSSVSTSVLTDVVLRLHPQECFSSSSDATGEGQLNPFSKMRLQAKNVLAERLQLSEEGFQEWYIFDPKHSLLPEIQTVPSEVSALVGVQMSRFCCNAVDAPSMSPSGVRGLFGALEHVLIGQEELGDEALEILVDFVVDTLHNISSVNFSSFVSVVQATVQHVGTFDAFREAVLAGTQAVFLSSALRMHHSDVVELLLATHHDQWLFTQLIETLSSSAKLENLQFETVDWQKVVELVNIVTTQYHVDRQQFLAVFFPLARSATTLYCQDCNGIIQVATAVSKFVADKAPLLTNQCGNLLFDATPEDIVQLVRITSIGADVSYSRKLEKKFSQFLAEGSIPGKQIVELATIVASPSLKKLLQKSLESGVAIESWEELVISRKLPPDVVKTICTRERLDQLISAGDEGIERQLEVALVCAEAISPLPNMIRNIVNERTLPKVFDMVTPKNASSIILLTPDNAEAVASHLVMQKDESLFRQIPVVNLAVVLNALENRPQVQLQLIRSFAKKVDAATFADVADAICALLSIPGEMRSSSGDESAGVEVDHQVFEVLMVTATRLLRGAASGDIARIVNDIFSQTKKAEENSLVSSTVRAFFSRVDLRICDEARRFSDQQLQDIAAALEAFDCISPTLKAIAAGDIVPTDDDDDDEESLAASSGKTRPSSSSSPSSSSHHNHNRRHDTRSKRYDEGSKRRQHERGGHGRRHSNNNSPSRTDPARDDGSLLSSPVKEKVEDETPKVVAPVGNASEVKLQQSAGESKSKFSRFQRRGAKP